MSKIIMQLTGEGHTVDVSEDMSGRISFIGDADVDGDGAPHCYHPDEKKGLDFISNAKTKSGKFVGVLTDSHVNPLIQGPDDPAPGFYISTTSYEFPEYASNTQRRYLNSELVSFIVVPPELRMKPKGIVLGCRAQVTNIRNGKTVAAMVGDIGPRNKIGEISIAACAALGLASSPKYGGTDDLIIRYELFPGTPAIVGGITYPLIKA